MCPKPRKVFSERLNQSDEGAISNCRLRWKLGTNVAKPAILLDSRQVPPSVPRSYFGEFLPVVTQVAPDLPEIVLPLVRFAPAHTGESRGETNPRRLRKSNFDLTNSPTLAEGTAFFFVAWERVEELVVDVFEEWGWMVCDGRLYRADPSPPQASPILVRAIPRQLPRRA